MEQISIDGKKLLKVVKSCETEEHLKYAYKYYVLFRNKYSNYQKWISYGFYIDTATGYLQGRLDGFNPTFTT